MTTGHDRPHDLAAPYALDALDESERSAFERHLAECADCRTEVEGLQEATAALATAQAEAMKKSGRRKRMVTLSKNRAPMTWGP